MRYYILSDIHGNLDALDAVLQSIGKEAAGAYLCLGDVVGYGADPVACLKRVRSISPRVMIAGNHEWGVLGSLRPEYFNEYALEAVEWTRDELTAEEIGYLRSFKIEYRRPEFELVHGTLDEPGEFKYILGQEDTRGTFDAMRSGLCFVGHSHTAGIFVSEGDGVLQALSSRVSLEPGKKYIVNAGSVGQPRDRDPRAAYAVYDEEDGSVRISRVEYNVKSARKKILDAGLPAYLGDRLLDGR